MPITETDIKLLASARMTDTPDGGGRMTGNVVQSGVDNNIFDDVSNLDRVYGNVSLRKVFPSILTNTTDKYLGARVIIDEAPADSNVHGLLFDASSLFDTRSGAKVKVEGYLSRGVLAFCYLFGDHIVGQSSIMLASAEEREAPPIGTVFVLRAQTAAASNIYIEQYVRVTNVSSTFMEFFDSDGARYILRLSTCDISDPLRYDLKGWGPVRFGFVDSDMLAETINATRTTVHISVVADASQYYGIRPLVEAAVTGAFGVKADSAYSPLLPSAQIETPVADARTNGVSTVFTPGGGPITMATLTPAPSAKTYIGASVLPGSLTCVSGAVTVADNGAGVLTFGGSDVGTIDYANGILTASTDVFGGRVNCDVTYTPAAGTSLVNKSIGIAVTTNNRSLSFAYTLASTPALRSLSVSYLAGGRWYTLSDTGAGVASGSAALKGSDAGYGAGVINYTTLTIIITFGALPDVGSSIIVSWAEAGKADTVTTYTASPLLLGGRMFCPLNTSGVASTAPGAATLPPNGLTLTWNDGVARSASDNGAGQLTGDAVGTVNYQSGVVMWSPNTMPAKGTVVVMDAARKTSVTTEITATGWHTSTLSFSLGGAVEPNSVTFPVKLLITYTPPATLTFPDGDGPVGGEYTLAPIWFTDRNCSARDDGLGNIVAIDTEAPQSMTVQIGTINYATGAVVLDGTTVASRTLYLMNAPIMKVVPYPGVPFPGVIHPPTLEVWARRAVGKLQGNSVIGFAASSGSFFVTAAVSPTTNSTPLSVAVPAFMAAMEYVPPSKTLGGTTFKLGADTFVTSAVNALIRNVNPSTGVGTDVGTVTPALGLVQLSTWVAGTTTAVTDFRAALMPATSGTDAPFGDNCVTFRTSLAPLRPSTLQILGTMSDGVSVNTTAGADGWINGLRVKGRVNVETGVVDLIFCNPSPTSLGTIDLASWGIPGVGVVNVDQAKVETLRYNAVAYTYMPLDATVLGLDPVRLPSDGRVPIFKSGRVVVIHNTVKMAPATVTNSQTVDCGRTRLARIRVFGADGLEITSGFAKNLDAGTISFTNVAGFSQPVVVEHRIEDEALCAEAQITGDLRLTRPLTHDFPADTSYVSSALVKGTLQASAQDAFSQETWTNVWSDNRIGVPILAAYNDTANPIVVTNAGAITERWLILFTSNTAFSVVGEEVGQIITGDTATPLAPVNPATGVPYFTLQPAGWGAGWVAGNVLRFNTVGAGFPLWVSRTVMQSPAAPPGSDQMTISIRGDIDQ